MSKLIIIWFSYTLLLLICTESRKCRRGWSREVCFINSIKENIVDQRYLIDHLKRRYNMYLDEMPQQKEKYLYLGNLANNFLLVRRLTKFWPPLLLFVKTAYDSGNKPEIKSIDYALDAEDLWKSALTCLARLQETYDIATEELVSGGLNGTYTKSRFTADDCFNIGTFYLGSLYHPSRALEWLLIAYRMIKKDSTVCLKKIMEQIYLAQCYTGDSKKATFTLKSLQEMYPYFELSDDFKVDYDYIHNKTCMDIAEGYKLYLNNLGPHDVLSLYSLRRLCRKENYHPSTYGRLKCRLLDYHRPHLRMRPLKMEELHLDPPVLMFHNFIHDHEIDTLLRTYYNRTSYTGPKDYEIVEDKYHDTQYNFHIQKGSDGLDDTLSKRAAEAANMDLYKSDPSNLASYGIAGEIKTHPDIHDVVYDASGKADYATFLTYLTDDQEGGFTIFPRLNLTVIPIKGNAILYFDRWPDLTYIEEMVHSGCPVLRGYKWVLVKWFHAAGQNYPECELKEKKSFKYYYL